MVRLAESAANAGVDIAGLQCTITGEPITSARIDVLRVIGATAMPDYGSVESGGTIAYGCLDPRAPDDVHVFSDVNAVIAAQIEALPDSTLLVTSLLASSPFVLLNVSMGDRAVVTERACGCPMHQLGWTTHLHDIRSFEKLSAGGVTFPDRTVVDILEQLLPSQFGGGPTDYQLIEDVGTTGEPRLRLLVNPRLGQMSTAAVRDAFLAALAATGEIEGDMAGQWHESGTLQVAREAPRQTRAGKILHLVARETDGAHHGQ